MSRRIRTAAPLLLLAGWLAPVSLAGQDPVRRDTALEVLPDSVRRVFADTTPGPAQRYPARLGALRGPTHEVFTCDQACVHASPALSLLELLIERVPGMTAIRAGFFAGPHHAFDGPFGPGFVSLFVDGREIVSLDGAATDLRRISLNYVERVAVYRGAAGLVVDVDLRRHDAAQAYSRISGGTGDPALQILDGVFANGLGQAFNVEGAFELLDVTTGGVENDRFGAFGRLSWIPGSNRFGLQLEFRTESADRAAADTADVRRREVLIRARGDLGARAQLEAYAFSASHRLVLPGIAEDSAPRRGADGVGARITVNPGRGQLSAGVRLMGRDAYASVAADVAAWYPVGPFWVEGGAELGSWNEFSTRSARAGLAYADTLLVPLTVRGFAAFGDRGFGIPRAGLADSVGFDAIGGAVDLGLGPYSLSGRLARGRLDRPLKLGVSFDSAAVVDAASIQTTSWEARLEGPIVPLGGILDGVEPIRLEAYWRQNRPREGIAVYVPESLARGQLSLHDTFFGGNLEIWLGAFLERRGPRLVPMAGSPDLVQVAADTWPGGHFMFKIGDFRFFWRFTNPSGLIVSDIPGANFPARVNLFGIRWEFFN